MSEFYNNLKTLVLGTKTAGIDGTIDASMQSIEVLSSKLSTNKYLETIKTLITQTGVDPTSDMMKSFQPSQQVQLYDQTGRVSRYAEYDSIINKISYCQRALITLTDHILSPDEITKKSLVFTSDAESDKENLKNTIARCKEIEKKLLMENKLNKIVYNTLKKGDLFAEILHSPRGQNALTILHEGKELDSNDFKVLIQSPPILVNENVTIIDGETKKESDPLEFKRNIILEYAPFSGPFSGMGSDTWGANITGGGVNGRAITYKNNDMPPTRSKDQNPVGSKDDKDPDFKSKYSDEEEAKKNSDKFKLKDIFLTIHNPKFVIRLETERFRSCLGFLVFPKIDPSMMAAATSFSFSSNSVDAICMNIVNRLHDTLKSSNDKIVLSKDLKDSVMNYLKVLKNNEDLRIRYVPPELMIHWRLNTDRYDPYGESIFESVNFDCRLLIALKTANTIKKLTGATDKRVVYVETGLPRDAKNIIESMKESLNKKKMSIGTMGSIDTIPSQIATFETIYIPMRDGKKFVEIEKQEWGADANQDTEMLKFMRDGIVSTLGVPAPYLGLEENCVSELTRIPLLEGYSIEIKELVKHYNKDPENFNQWTYSIDPLTNNVVPGKIKSATYTRMNSQMVRVHLDNEKYEDTTPDHLWMMRDGSYKKAEHLKEGDSLMPFYTKNSNFKTANNTPYKKVYLPGKNSWHPIYRLVPESLLLIESGDAQTVHHKDRNVLNNHPENLLVCSSGDHCRIHTEDQHNNLNLYSIWEDRKCIICQKEFNCKIQTNQITCLSSECITQRKVQEGNKSWQMKKERCGEDYNIVKTICCICGKEFETYKKYVAEAEFGWISCGEYKCGRILAGRVNTKHAKIRNHYRIEKCEICGKEIEIDDSKITKTCSIKCTNTVLARRRFKGNRQLFHCFVCGKDIYPSEAERRLNRFIPCENEDCIKVKSGAELYLKKNPNSDINDYLEKFKNNNLPFQIRENANSKRKLFDKCLIKEVHEGRSHRYFYKCNVCGCEVAVSKGDWENKKYRPYKSCKSKQCFNKVQGLNTWYVRGNQNLEESELLPILNHKVVRIEFLNETQNCCDLEIEKYHNFAVDSGVFVHNSSNRSLLSTENINFCRTIISYQKELSVFLKETFEKVYKLLFADDDFSELDKIKITFQEPKISPYEHEMEYVETMQRLIEALKTLDVPVSWLKKKYLPTIDWDEVEKFKAEETIQKELSEVPSGEQNMMGGMTGGGGSLY